MTRKLALSGGLLAIMGCQGPPDLPKLPYLEGRVELEEGLEMERVRAGLFLTDRAVVRGPDGVRETYEPSRFSVWGVYDDGTVAPFLGSSGATVEYEPVQEFEIGEDGVFRLTPPLSFPKETQRLVVWYDEDYDGLLELSESDTSECGRTPLRAFDEFDGAMLKLGLIRTSHDSFVVTTANTFFNDDFVEIDLETDHAEGWALAMTSGNCQPTPP